VETPGCGSWTRGLVSRKANRQNDGRAKGSDVVKVSLRGAAGQMVVAMESNPKRCDGFGDPTHERLS
jgi:hypothetical protein